MGANHWHARSRGLHKDGRQFVCAEDPEDCLFPDYPCGGTLLEQVNVGNMASMAELQEVVNAVQVGESISPPGVVH